MNYQRYSILCIGSDLLKLNPRNLSQEQALALKKKLKKEYPNYCFLIIDSEGRRCAFSG